MWFTYVCLVWWRGLWTVWWVRTVAPRGGEKMQGGAWSWPGAASLVVGAAFYVASKAVGKNAKALEGAEDVAKLDQLETWIHLLPMVVALHGRVGCEQALECEHARGKGVIYEQVAEQHFLKQTENGEWVRDAAVVLTHARETPWWIDQGGKERVHVHDAKNASGLQLEKVYDAFETTSKGMVRSSIDYLRGIKLLGVRRTERVLAVGTPLTCVGELAQEGNGKYVLRKPAAGEPFYITRKSLPQLTGEISALARQCKWFAIGFAGVGVFLLARRLTKYLVVRRRAKTFRKRAVDAERSRRQGQTSSQTGQENEGAGERAHQSDRAPDLCVICLEGSLETVFTACGHSCCCTRCSVRLSKCPICRAPSPILRIYKP